MSKRHPSAVKKYHDRVAPRYDHSYTNAFWSWHDALTWDYLKPHLPADLSGEVIDLGCGTGKWSARILKSGYTVTCLDISHRMLDQARRKIEDLGGLGRATFAQADLNDLSELPREHYALAVAMGDPIGCAESPARAMKQIRRILKPGGVLVATFDNRLSAIDFYLEEGDVNTLARFLKDGRTHWLTKEPSEQFPITTYTPTGLAKLVESTGFSMIEMLGKTVLPMRRHRHLLESSSSARAWAKIEKKLCRQPDALARASHLQIVCRVV